MFVKVFLRCCGVQNPPMSSSISFLVREDKDNVWQDEEARERLCGVLFRPTIPFTQGLSTIKRLGNACGVLQGREKEKKVLIASVNSMK